MTASLYSAHGRTSLTVKNKHGQHLTGHRTRSLCSFLLFWCRDLSWERQIWTLWWMFFQRAPCPFGNGLLDIVRNLEKILGSLSTYCALCTKQPTAYLKSSVSWLVLNSLLGWAKGHSTHFSYTIGSFIFIDSSDSTEESTYPCLNVLVFPVFHLPL